MRRLVTLACLLVAGRALADGARVRWSGVAGDGRAPATLEKASAAHIAVALKQLGLTMVTLPPASADASASCTFATPRSARCLVEVQASGGARAQKHAVIPFHDAEDLAESLALIVADVLAAQFPEVLAPQAQSATTPMAPAPNQPPTPTQPPQNEAQRRESEGERQRRVASERARQVELARQAEYEERAVHPGQARAKSGIGAGRLVVEGALAGTFGLGPANPTIGGGLIRVLWAGGPLRAGGTLSLGGSSQSSGAYTLGWFRGLAAARVGAGILRGIVDFDATLGPALLIASADAEKAGYHYYATLAFVVGPHLSIGLGHGLAIGLGADLQVAVTDEKVESGTTRIAQLSHAALEASLGLCWRR